MQQSLIAFFDGVYRQEKSWLQKESLPLRLQKRANPVVLCNTLQPYDSLGLSLQDGRLVQPSAMRFAAIQQREEQWMLFHRERIDPGQRLQR